MLFLRFRPFAHRPRPAAPGHRTSQSARRLRLAVAAGAWLVAAFAGPAAAQTYPNKPIRMVLGYAAGGAADVTYRAMQVQLEKELGQPIVVDYKAGAGATIAAEFISRATPDGYTLHLMDSGALTIAPGMMKKPKYHPVDSFTFIGTVARGGNALVVAADSPARSVPELITMLRSKPKAFTYATSGVGGAAHLAAELFQTATRTSMVHAPYKGGSQAMTELLGGHVPILFGSLGTVIPQVQAGKVRVLAVTSGSRSLALPDIPTLAEQGVNAEAALWWTLVGPPGLPPAIASRLQTALKRVLDDPGVRANLTGVGYDAWHHNDAFARDVARSDSAKWAIVIRDAKIDAE